MHFDDRLATVLRHRAGGERAARTQYRQLLDLLGQRRHGRDESLLAAAWLRLGALGETIPVADRAAIVCEPGWRFHNPELAAHLAEDEPPVAAAALAVARLAEDDWAALIPRLPIRARGFLRLRRDLPEAAMRVLDRLGVSDRALPLPQADEPLVLTEEVPETAEERSRSIVMPFPAPLPANDAADPPPAREMPSREMAEEDDDDRRPVAIAALVERIEAFQRSRSEARDARAGELDSHPALPFIDLHEPASPAQDEGIVFTTDSEGRIDWADEPFAAMMRYLVLPDAIGREAQLTMQHRLPLAAVAVRLEGAPRIAGDWYCDAAPRFDPLGGRFVGYAGRLRRPGDHAAGEAEDASDRIRQLLHELRTPVNAIQGFAEVIQQQLFGPVPHEYRALAATIVGDAARILAGFEELDRLAKLESGAREMEPGASDFSAVVEGQLRQLAAILGPRNAGFAARIEPDCTVGLAAAETEALSWRILAALGAALAPGETVALTLERAEMEVTVDCALPAALAGREDIFSAGTPGQAGSGVLTPGSFGSGFALRLARAEARAAGGMLTRTEDRLLLTLPLLTAQAANLSADAETRDAAQPAGS